MKATGLKRDKACRHFGQKMGLKAERCASPKCAFTRRSYPPGVHGPKMRRKRRSEYGEQLLEKQRVRMIYGVSEQVFKRSVRDAVKHSRTSVGMKNVLDLIHEQLERRLDSVVYRLGFVSSRSVGRQAVSHGHILVNGRRTTTPSHLVRIGDVVSIRPASAQKPLFAEMVKSLEKMRMPNWLSLDVPNATGKVVALPSREEAVTGADFAKVVEFYSR